MLKQTPPRRIEAHNQKKSRKAQHPKQTKPRPVIKPAEVVAATNGAEDATIEPSVSPPVGAADSGGANASVAEPKSASSNLDVFAALAAEEEEENGPVTTEQKSQPKLKRPKGSSKAAGKSAGVGISTGTPTGKRQDDFRKISGVDKDKLRKKRMDSSRLSRVSKRAALLEKKRKENDAKPKPAPINTNFEVVGAQIETVDSADAEYKSEETTTNAGADDDELFLRNIQDDLDSAVREGIDGLLQMGKEPTQGDY